MTKKRTTVKRDDIVEMSQQLSAAYQPTVSLEEWTGIRLWRLAEALQTARRARVISNLPYRVEEYFECQLCAGKSADLQGEIRHESYCPLERLK